MPASTVARVILGTAQLGLTYGIGNRTGQPSAAEGLEILNAAYAAGIRNLDTAQAYGGAERLIGTYHQQAGARPFRLYTKIQKGVDLESLDSLRSSLRQSRENLQAPIVCTLLHDSSVLKKWSVKIADGLNHLLEEGLTEQVGVSVYTPEEFRLALMNPVLKFIQAPLNILDRRLLNDKSGDLDLGARGKKIALRSVFLQGLLLMNVDQIPVDLAEAKPTLTRFSKICNEHNCSRLHAALGFALAALPEALVVVGVETLAQLQEIIEATERRLPPDLLNALQTLPVGSEKLIDPRQWRSA